MTSRELLESGAGELGIKLSPGQIDSFFVYLGELAKWNRKINLTAIKEERDIIIKHVLDSLSYQKGFSQFPGLKLLDMGSGAGFPALPIKIAQPGLQIAMVESVKKKASFLRHIARTLALQGVEVIDKRTDELARSCFAAYDVVTARAFAVMDTALSVGSPFLKPGGLMVLSRGPEEAISAQELEPAGVVLEKRIDLTLPHSAYKRAIWVFKKL